MERLNDENIFVESRLTLEIVFLACRAFYDVKFPVIVKW